MEVKLKVTTLKLYSTVNKIYFKKNLFLFQPSFIKLKSLFFLFIYNFNFIIINILFVSQLFIKLSFFYYILMIKKFNYVKKFVSNQKY